MATIKLHVNGESHEIEVDPATPLVYVLRNQLGLTGAKLGCGLEQCGACAVLVDGERTLSCSRAASEFAGQEIVTIEGVGRSALGAALQQAFMDEGAAQCGYCTPGIIVTAASLLSEIPSPATSEIRAALNDQLCRCGSHARVIRAVERVAKGGQADAA